jgi:adenylate cyclase
MAAAGAGLVLGDEVEVLAKGMKEPLHCRQLLGHADHPGLDIQTAAGCTALPDPVPVQFVTLTGKHFDEKMEAAKFVALSRRQAVLETGSTVPLYSNLLVRLEAVNGESGEPELYAKVIRCVVESSNRYLIQFTSVPPEVLKRLNRLAGNDRPQV